LNHHKFQGISAIEKGPLALESFGLF